MALQKVSGSVIAGTIDDKDWLAQIKAEYRVNNSVAAKDTPVKELPNNINESLTDLAQKVLGPKDVAVLNDKTFNYKNAYKTLQLL